ncbi:MAG: amidohydrolase family protein [Cyclobacteriaceae bacterium]|nr:amidohydrolase family protein [Cyclobacteriaceae bacterium HetDA_MAG_MS6]
MMRTIKVFFLVFLSLIVFNSTFGQRQLVYAGVLIDGYSDKAISERTVIVESGKITAVKKGYVTPAENDEVIDLKEMTVLPGFIDMHVHMESQSSPSTYIDRFKLNKADVAFKSSVYARKTLLAGFTTVRDLGGSGVNIALRNAIRRGDIDGPRIYTAGKSLAITGGHADPTNGYRADLMGDPGPKEGVVNSVEDGKKAVRQRYKNGADLIKITATGGVLSVAKDGTGPHFKEEEIAAIVSAASDLGYHVAAHAHGDEGMARAVRAGVKTIEHGTYMSESTMDLMKERDAYLVPTITAGMAVAEKAAVEGYYPAVVASKARVIGPLIQNTFAKAYKRGVPIVFGTDAGVFDHGDNAKEFFYMVEAGMPAMKAIKSATTVAANILEASEEFGGIRVGLSADMVAVEGDPLVDVSVLQSVIFVMKEGKVYKQD